MPSTRWNTASTHQKQPAPKVAVWGVVFEFSWLIAMDDRNNAREVMKVWIMRFMFMGIQSCNSSQGWIVKTWVSRLGVAAKTILVNASVLMGNE